VKNVLGAALTAPAESAAAAASAKPLNLKVMMFPLLSCVSHLTNQFS
jgi:hypothetical protein